MRNVTLATLLILIVGAALSPSGETVQGSTRCNLSDPYLAGYSCHAGLQIT